MMYKVYIIGTWDLISFQVISLVLREPSKQFHFALLNLKVFKVAFEVDWTKLDLWKSGHRSLREHRKNHVIYMPNLPWFLNTDYKFTLEKTVYFLFVFIVSIKVWIANPLADTKSKEQLTKLFVTQQVALGNTRELINSYDTVIKLNQIVRIKIV